jgi:hypothetical protein
MLNAEGKMPNAERQIQNTAFAFQPYLRQQMQNAKALRKWSRMAQNMIFKILEVTT